MKWMLWHFTDPERNNSSIPGDCCMKVVFLLGAVGSARYLLLMNFWLAIVKVSPGNLTMLMYNFFGASIFTKVDQHVTKVAFVKF